MQIKGFKTLGASAVFFLVGIAGVFDTVDMTPILQLFIKNPVSLSLALCLIGILFGVLRYFTDSPMGSSGWGPEPDQVAPLKFAERDAGV